MKPFKLDNEPKMTSGFNIPEGYFDSFADNVLSKLPKEEPKVISIFSRRKTWYYATAAVVVLLLSVPIYNNYYGNSDEVDTIALEEYITNHSTISDDDIVTLLEKEDLDKIKLDLNLQEDEVEDILLNNTDIEQYITN